MPIQDKAVVRRNRLIKKLTWLCLSCSMLLVVGCFSEKEAPKGMETAKEVIVESAVEEKHTTPQAVTEQVQKEESEVAMISENNITITIEEIKNAPSGTIFEKEQLLNVDLGALFYQQEISDSLFDRIYGKSFKEGSTVPRENLVYLRMLYYGFDEQSHVGEMIVSKEVASDVLAIFSQLYAQDYPIEKMRLIDDYDGDDEASMADNNTCGFNYRNISHSEQLSNHSYGKAIDVNPLYNPYVKTVNGVEICEPINATEYIDRSKSFPYKITSDDLCCRLFKEYGFTWGGDWNNSKDYQHFEK